MMETAQSVIHSALQELLVQANESDIQSADFGIALRYMNRMMASYAAQGISLGYTNVTNAASVITVPDGAIEGIVFNLAVRLAPQYDIEPTPHLLINARDGRDAMLNLAVDIQPSQMPSTMPIGSGNEDNGTCTTHFYPSQGDELLTEGNGSILLEDDTSGQ